MLLVYALTQATQHGWATAATIGLLAASAALVVAFVVDRGPLPGAAAAAADLPPAHADGLEHQAAC